MFEVEVRRHSASQPWTYEMLDRRQREIAARARAGGPGALLLSEVAPVVTMGRRAGPGELLLPRDALRAQGIEVYPVDRGGLATYHGPGQWVLFAVDRLEALTGDRRGVRKAVCGLLSAARETGVRYTDGVEIRDGAETGVWCPRGKFAAVGVHIEQGVLLHGLAVNGYRIGPAFVGLKPCGLDAPVAYLLDDASGFERLGEELVAAVRREYE